MTECRNQVSTVPLNKTKQNKQTNWLTTAVDLSVKDLYDQSMTAYNNNNEINTHPKTKQQQQKTKPLVLNKDYSVIDENVRLM